MQSTFPASADPKNDGGGGGCLPSHPQQLRIANAASFYCIDVLWPLLCALFQLVFFSEIFKPHPRYLTLDIHGSFFPSLFKVISFSFNSLPSFRLFFWRKPRGRVLQIHLSNTSGRRSFCRTCMSFVGKGLGGRASAFCVALPARSFYTVLNIDNFLFRRRNLHPPRPRGTPCGGVLGEWQKCPMRRTFVLHGAVCGLAIGCSVCFFNYASASTLMLGCCPLYPTLMYNIALNVRLALSLPLGCAIVR